MLCPLGTTASLNPLGGLSNTRTWRDLDGNTQSKLLLSPPEAVLAVAVRGEAQTGAAREQPRAGGGSRKPTATIDRRKARRREREPAPA